LPSDLFFAAHRLGHLLARAKLFYLFFPAHAIAPKCAEISESRGYMGGGLGKFLFIRTFRQNPPL
jgi:hypothetical protein